MPVALAGILSFLLEPIVVRLERLALPRQLAVAVVLVAVLLIGAAIVGVVADQAGRLAQALPAYEGNLRNKIHALTHPSLIGGVWQDAFHSLQALETELFPAAAPGTEAPAPAAAVQQPATRILSYLMAFIPTAGTIFLVGILTLFLLLQYRDLRTRLVRLMGESEIGRSAQALDDYGSALAHRSPSVLALGHFGCNSAVHSLRGQLYRRSAPHHRGGDYRPGLVVCNRRCVDLHRL